MIFKAFRVMLLFLNFLLHKVYPTVYAGVAKHIKYGLIYLDETVVKTRICQNSITKFRK